MCARRNCVRQQGRVCDSFDLTQVFTAHSQLRKTGRMKAWRYSMRSNKSRWASQGTNTKWIRALQEILSNESHKRKWIGWKYHKKYNATEKSMCRQTKREFWWMNARMNNIDVRDSFGVAQALTPHSQLPNSYWKRWVKAYKWYQIKLWMMF